jgi:hypothetical protein
MRTNEHQLLDIWRLPSCTIRIGLRDPLRADPAFQKLCQEKQP